MVIDMKNKSFILIFLLLLIMFIPVRDVSAKTLQDMYDQLADLQVKYNNNKKSLKQCENYQNVTETQSEQIQLEKWR